MDSNNTNDVFKNLFSGEGNYLTGILIILANIIGFVTHFKKSNTPMFTYGLLVLLILIGSFLAHL